MPQGSETAHQFDAAERGCHDGIARDLVAHLAAIEIGDRLTVTVRDPSARSDLPPLVRMLGHRILDIDEPRAGTLVLTVEKGR